MNAPALQPAVIAGNLDAAEAALARAFEKHHPLKSATADWQPFQDAVRAGLVDLDRVLAWLSTERARVDDPDTSGGKVPPCRDLTALIAAARDRAETVANWGYCQLTFAEDSDVDPTAHGFGIVMGGDFRLMQGALDLALARGRERLSQLEGRAGHAANLPAGTATTLGSAP